MFSLAMSHQEKYTFHPLILSFFKEKATLCLERQNITKLQFLKLEVDTNFVLQVKSGRLDFSIPKSGKIQVNFKF